ncbi:FecCD family ABC transporter permease [Marinibaculum pumilum]|uniref:FecCD family ABC transporter permease n=1 Tax=Marinibaculum pumilum TaxID=1766165 RepID=A0ABV7L8P6_9PROT
MTAAQTPAAQTTAAQTAAARREPPPPALLAAALVALLVLSLLASIITGYVDLPAGTVLGTLLAGGSGDAALDLVVLEIRLPRALLGATVGGALGAAGAAMQGLLRNPLADPGIIGVSQCAALGAVATIYFGLAGASVWLLPAAGMAGAMLAAIAMQVLAGRDASVLTVILAGVAIGSIAWSLTSLAMNLSPNVWAVREIVFWLLGSLKDRSNTEILAAAPFVAAGLALIFSCGRGLEALALGEETAASLGVNLNALKARAILGVALAVGAAVSIAGSIAFVGLMVPHVMRPLVGQRPQPLLWASALAGAILVVAADIVTRAAPTNQELNLGVITALLGAPFFLTLILRSRRSVR